MVISVAESVGTIREYVLFFLSVTLTSEKSPSAIGVTTGANSTLFSTGSGSSGGSSTFDLSPSLHPTSPNPARKPITTPQRFILRSNHGFLITSKLNNHSKP
jgi:hypothetical protein